MAENSLRIEGEGEFPLRRRTWRAVAIQSILLMGLWLLLSGHYDLFHITLGVISVLIVSLLNAKINHLQFFSKDVPEWERMQFGRALAYIPWLLWQIVLASLQVAFVVLSPRMPVDPSLLRFRANLPNAGARVILGNSITLTPGTLTIEIHNDVFLVHSLIPESYESLVDGSMPVRVAQLFRKRAHEVVSDIRITRTSKDV